jgi:hypothetical protein
MFNIAAQGRIILEHPASFFGAADDGRIIVLSRQGQGTFLTPDLSILSRFSIANQPSGLALSLDGLELAVTAADGISFYSTSTFEKTGYLNDAFLSCLYGSPDLFWTCSRFSPQTAVLEVWNRGSKTRIAKLKVGDPHGNSHFWVWPHPLVGSVVVWAAAGQDGQSLFWATLDGDAIRLVRFRDLDFCSPPGFSPDGKEFLVPGEGELLRYAYPDGPLLGKMNKLPEDETIGDYVLYLDERRALLTSIEGRMFVVDVHEMEVLDEAALDGPDLTFFLRMPGWRFLSVHRNWSGDHDQLMVWTATSALDGL